MDCRICCSYVTSTHCVTIFSKPSLASKFPQRLSKVADVPVAPDDGLSTVICRPCHRKFTTAESFQTAAKSSYQKSQATQTRKRTKETRGNAVSPITHQCRPASKRPTVGGLAGRRLVFSASNDSQCKKTN